MTVEQAIRIVDPTTRETALNEFDYQYEVTQVAEYVVAEMLRTTFLSLYGDLCKGDIIIEAIDYDRVYTDKGWYKRWKVKRHGEWYYLDEEVDNGV